jgi:hypothetical protein
MRIDQGKPFLRRPRWRCSEMLSRKAGRDQPLRRHAERNQGRMCRSDVDCGCRELNYL